MADNWVLSFTHLKDRPKSEVALETLQRIAKLVKPIMRKHSWKLPVLSEFFPAEQNLVGLNVNRGQKILLRLRPAWAPDTFFEEEDVIHTMLHELTHNVHGPHDATFYKFLESLEAEYDAVKRSGWAGEGFHTPGVRLGGGVSRDIPPYLARQRALTVAEKRKAHNGLMAGGGRLGGGQGVPKMSLRELAAEAAIKRAKDEKACGETMAQVAEQETQNAARDGVSTQASVIDLTVDVADESDDVIVIDGDSVIDIDSDSDVEVEQSEVAGPSKAIPQAIPGKRRRQSSASRLASPPRGRPYVPQTQWECPSCTLENSRSEVACRACASMRPLSISTSSQDCWICTRCTLINPSSAAMCTVCEHAAPITAKLVADDS